MALSFPRAMPEAGAMQHMFELQRVDYLSPENSGRLLAVTSGWPLWHLTIGLTNMMTASADIWRAWVATQRGPQRLFFGRDLSRPVPLFHAGGRPFTAAPTGWTQTIDGAGNAIVVLQGTAGTVLSLGDYIGFVWGGTKRSLVRVVEGGASLADGTITVTVEPPVPSITPSDAAINLNNPECLMRLVTTGTQLGDQMYGGLWTASGGKVEAIQDLVT